MPIGTSDGKVYDTEWDHAASQYVDPEGRPRLTVTPEAPDLDPLLPETRYDDTPTPQQNARDGSIYNNLKQEELGMEQKLEMYTPDNEPLAPTPLQVSQTTNPEMGLSQSLLEKPMTEPFKDDVEKSDVMSLLLQADGDPFEIAALRQKRAVLSKDKPERSLPLAAIATHMAEGIVKALTAPGKAWKQGLTSEEEISNSFNLATMLLLGPMPVAKKGTATLGTGVTKIPKGWDLVEGGAITPQEHATLFGPPKKLSPEAITEMKNAAASDSMLEYDLAMAKHEHNVASWNKWHPGEPLPPALESFNPGPKPSSFEEAFTQFKQEPFEPLYPEVKPASEYEKWKKVAAEYKQNLAEWKNWETQHLADMKAMKETFTSLKMKEPDFGQLPMSKAESVVDKLKKWFSEDSILVDVVKDMKTPKEVNSFMTSFGNLVGSIIPKKNPKMTPEQILEAGIKDIAHEIQSKRTYYDYLKYKNTSEPVLSEIEHTALNFVDKWNPKAREARAKAQGFTVDAYHGTPGSKGNWESLEIRAPREYGFYSTAHPELAELYAGSGHHKNPQILPLKINTQEYLVYDAKGKSWTSVNETQIEKAIEQGKKGIVIHNVWDEPATKGILPEPKTVFITLDPTTVRSKFAKFSESGIGLNNLLASGAALILGKSVVDEAKKD